MQITKDKEALAVLRETVSATRDRTNVLRQETAAQKRELDQSLLELKETRATLKKLEKAVAKALREQKARYAAVAAQQGERGADHPPGGGQAEGPRPRDRQAHRGAGRQGQDPVAVQRDVPLADGQLQRQR